MLEMLSSEPYAAGYAALLLALAATAAGCCAAFRWADVRMRDALLRDQRNRKPTTGPRQDDNRRRSLGKVRSPAHTED